MYKASAFALLVAALFIARPASAQSDEPTAATKQKAAAVKGADAARAAKEAAGHDSLNVAEIQKAAERLAASVQEVVRKATEDPEVKLAALRLAKSSVEAAQVVVTQQASTLEKVLDQLARDVAAMSAEQARKIKTP